MKLFKNEFHAGKRMFDAIWKIPIFNKKNIGVYSNDVNVGSEIKACLQENNYKLDDKNIDVLLLTGKGLSIKNVNDFIEIKNKTKAEKYVAIFPIAEEKAYVELKKHVNQIISLKISKDYNFKIDNFYFL